MRKKVATIVEVMVLVILISGLFLIFVGCDKTPVEPVFEIKLYDDNWEEIPKCDSGYGYVVEFEVEYDGNPKGFNAKCFVDGEEFYSYDYLNPIPESIKPNPLSISIDSTGSYPTERGRYKMVFLFRTIGKGANTFYTESGKRIVRSELPRNLKHDIILNII